MDFSWISQPESWVALLTLVALELVLGVDNIIFISILAGKLPKSDQSRARTTGIAMLFFRAFCYYSPFPGSSALMIPYL